MQDPQSPPPPDAATTAAEQQEPARTNKRSPKQIAASPIEGRTTNRFEGIKPDSQ